MVGNGALALAPDGGRYVNTHTGQLLVDLAARGLLPTYVGPATGYDPNSSLIDFELCGKGIASLSLERGSLTRRLGAIGRLFQAISRSDHVYLFFPGTISAIAARICRLLGKPYGLYVRGGNYAATPDSRAALSGARFALTVSPLIAREVETYGPAVDVIRPMVAISERDAFARPKRLSPPTTWRLLFVGRLEVDKGIRELIAAAETLTADGVPFTLRLVGGGPLYEELVQRQSQGAIAADIELTGLISDHDALMREYQNADIFVLPTYHEGFPRVLYEAMIKSLPIITTMVGGIPGRMKHEENCIAIPVRDAEAIVTAIRRLTGDLELLARLGEQGQNAVLNVLNTHRPHIDLIAENLNG